MDRRSFLRGAALLFATPAIVRVTSLMPVRSLPLVAAHDIDDDLFNVWLKENQAPNMQWFTDLGIGVKRHMLDRWGQPIGPRIDDPLGDWKPPFSNFLAKS